MADSIPFFKIWVYMEYSVIKIISGHGLIRLRRPV